MMITNIDIDNLLGPGPHKYDAIRFKLAQAVMRRAATETLTYKTITQLQDLGLMGDNGILVKGYKFAYQIMRVPPA